MNRLRFTLTRREALKVGALAVGTLVLQGRAPARAQGTASITLPPLPYADDALAPVISANTVSFHYGKPCFQALLENEKAEQIGALAISVCGPGGLGDSVREAARNVQGEKTVDLFEEAFSW